MVKSYLKNPASISCILLLLSTFSCASAAESKAIEVNNLSPDQIFDYTADQSESLIYKREESKENSEEKKAEAEAKKEQEERLKEAEAKKEQEAANGQKSPDQQELTEEQKAKNLEAEKLKDAEEKMETENKQDAEGQINDITKKPALNSWYRVGDSLFVTPKSHPGMFSFDSRWLAHRETYAASSWPATSLKLIVYGPECTLKLRAPRKEGLIKNHRLFVSVDSPNQYILSLPEYDAQKHPVFDIKVDFNQINPNLNISSQPTEVSRHTRHVVEIMSDEANPIELIGVSMAKHHLLSEGNAWLKEQKKIPHVEFIADKLSSQTPSLNQTFLYSATRELGFRSSYIHLYDTCFTGHCGDIPRGLNEQYQWLSPFAGNPTPADVRKEMPTYFLFEPSEPLYQTTLPQTIILDVGDNDYAYGVTGPEFMSHLQMFLASLIVNYSSEAFIYVIIREGRYVTETEDAIYSLQSPRIDAIKFGENTLSWYKTMLCENVGIYADGNTELYAKCLAHINSNSRLGKYFSTPSIFWFFLGAGFFGTILYHCISNRRSIEFYLRPKLSSYSSVKNQKLMAESV